MFLDAESPTYDVNTTLMFEKNKTTSFVRLTSTTMVNKDTKEEEKKLYFHRNMC